MNDDGLNHDLNDDKGGLNNDTNNSGNDGNSGDHKAFKFEIENGQVTAAFEVEDDGTLKSVDDGDETFTVDGKDVIRTETKPFGTEITRFSDVDGDGIFFRVSESHQINPGTPNPFKIHDELKFDPTDNDDFIAVRGGEHCRGGQGGDKFVFREADRLRIEDFHHDEGDRLVFDTGLGLQSKEHLASFITDIHFEGDNLIVEFGQNVSITLVGVHEGQISFDDVDVLS